MEGIYWKGRAAWSCIQQGCIQTGRIYWVLWSGLQWSAVVFAMVRCGLRWYGHFIFFFSGAGVGLNARHGLMTLMALMTLYDDMI